jgi:predicted ATPase
MNLHNEFFDQCVEKRNGEQDIFIINYKKAYQILNAHSVKTFVYHHEFEEFNNYLFKNDGRINAKELRKVEKKLFPFFTFNVYDKKNRGYNNLSYGEKMILTQLVSIFYKAVTSPRKSILIILDEPDISLHPSWQKKYLNQINHFLSKTNKNIQLLLSTHSPFLLSDIPKQNIIFLDTYKNMDEDVKNGTQKVGNCKVLKHDEVLDKKQTFGANIHTLLSDSFFMEDGLMGEFAKSKINEIIAFHEETEKKGADIDALTSEYQSKKDNFWQIQSIVGDEYLKQVLKNHLIEIEKKLLGKDRAKENEIKRTEAYLESLKHG